MESSDSLLDGATIIQVPPMDDAFYHAVQRLAQARRVVILSGAGVSVAAGIPDFRSATGLVARYSPQMFERQTFLDNPSLLYSVLPELLTSHTPTAAHAFAQLLRDRGTLNRIYTQNIDGLYGVNDWVVEFHGHLRSAHCAGCGEDYPIEVVQTAIRDDRVPECSICQGPIKPKIVLYGEPVDSAQFNQAQTDLAGADLVIIMGTSLAVAPFKLLTSSITCPVMMMNRDIPENYPFFLIPRTTFILGDIETISCSINDILSQYFAK
jgi:NAD-dependent deacetylase sirtuin 2